MIYILGGHRLSNCHNIYFCHTDLDMDVHINQYLENNEIWNDFLNMYASVYIKMSIGMKYIIDCNYTFPL